MGALRAFAPARGRGAFLPDIALVGLLALFLQSYAAAYSEAASLRWYMAAGGVLGAAAAHGLLGPPAARVWSGLRAPLGALARCGRRAAGRCARQAPAARRARGRRARREKNTAQNQEKSLPNKTNLLYNSNV